jgi:hypothetical protein
VSLQVNGGVRDNNGNFCCNVPCDEKIVAGIAVALGFIIQLISIIILVTLAMSHQIRTSVTLFIALPAGMVALVGYFYLYCCSEESCFMQRAMEL